MDTHSLIDSEGEGHGYGSAAYTKQSVTQSQLVALLSIIGNLTQSLRIPAFQEDDTVGGRACGGVAKALEASILKATDRIDDILDDKDRWGTGGTDSIEDMHKSLIDAQIETLQAQKAALQADVRPALVFKPRIVFIDGKWWAIHGDTMENRVVGHGDTPMEAVKSFEENYRNATKPIVTNNE